VAWIIEHVKPLSQALDWLAGDPAQIAAHAQTWRNIAGSLRDSAAELDRDVQSNTPDWHGTAADAYRTWAMQQQGAIGGLATAADAMATITEAAGFLIAGVRMLVRDAIATCVSRLVVYAAEVVGSLGLATPLVVEQVSTLVASWSGKIARWLKDLLASLHRLKGITGWLGEVIDTLKKILSRLRPGGNKPPRRPPDGHARQDLLDELKRRGVKHNPDDIVEIGKNDAGQIIFLENGNSRAGLQHIKERHASEFANIGIPEDKIGQLVFSAVTTGKVVGAQRTRPVYEVVFEGKLYKVAVSVGDNGFIVGANPVGH
jgi:hypothetical protein